MKPWLAVLPAAFLIIAAPFILHDRHGEPFLEKHLYILASYPAQYEAWQRIADQFLPHKNRLDVTHASPSEEPPKTIEKWRDAKGVTHFTELAQDSTTAGEKMKVVTMTAGQTYISQMPSQRTTYLLIAAAWLVALLTWLGLMWLLGKLYALWTAPQPASFSRFANMQTLREQHPEVKIEFTADMADSSDRPTSRVFPIRKTSPNGHDK